MSKERTRARIALKRIDMMMRAHGMSDEDIHDKTGLNMASIRRHLEEGRVPSPPVLRILAGALHSKWRFLAGRQDFDKDEEGFKMHELGTDRPIEGEEKSWLVDFLRQGQQEIREREYHFRGPTKMVEED